MNKLFIFLFIFLVFFSLFIIANPIFAVCTDPAATGLVPCGVSKFGPGPKQGMPTCPCELEHFFIMLANIYGFIVKYIATTLAVIMITVGAVFMMISAGNPGLAGTGRKMVYSAIIGLVLVFGSWLIVNALLELIGYTPPGGNPWFSL
ncbi:MAG: hypothetical protein A2312_03405 [Candidatus Staskawiczbacteria bacterium RIFOXYB2_FULL_32_9]|uniref:Uncharacterized protein n=1 Tax=Candidatus Staskawiczbacteria bacterium RIFOXYD1_FULL_32_13 TaxID=1802234 RepID=A0A1G2JN15_9BACT|nr:MAG: hypothetical protein UR22_C0036G0004 [Parcubacteria group bacterium GW2011_GWC2_32_10]OGZ78491.1 MAG: hypothetical protein A2360_05140 [Candidatus Staskawiczbacteria bacterium RIFOXYB1_FULL_32_11]OGZ82073.1 MAG: hypothetical protein A2312_03405 [Candidatus Staskawiczbacteria bacterium RIFOXYB2_FULL_32_9]OGZ88472.1 MAG: hypothetical protein A2561_03855 [Candidatus Staskawiczbacteria bacterium RIFOXYD1_FULL_32_13]